MLDITPVAGALGAEIHGLDLSCEPGPELIREIRQSLVEYEVIFLRDQDISPARQVIHNPSTTNKPTRSVASSPDAPGV